MLAFNIKIFKNILLASVFIFVASCKNTIENASQAFREGRVDDAQNLLKKIPKNSKMAGSASLLLKRIHDYQDSLREISDKTSFEIAKKQFLENKYTQASATLKKIDCTVKRPSSICSLSAAKELAEKAEALIEEQKEETRINDLSTRLDREISDLINSNYQPKSASADIQMAMVLLAAYQNLVDETKMEINSKIKNKRRQYEILVKKNRVFTLPRLRKDNGIIMNLVMWEHDVSVYVFGNGNRILEFTGAIFASNKGIQMIQSSLKDTPKLLRYKQVRYKWYKGADEFTYYDLNSPSDSDPYLLD